MIKKTAWILVTVLLLCLCGCQLAQPGEESYDTHDLLVGAFITRDSLNTAALMDSSGEEPSDGRIWAQLVQEPGVGSTYEFAEIEGILAANVRISDEKGDYTGASVGQGLSDVHIRSGGEDQGITGTVWMARNSQDAIFYMNPVYQTPEGDVYLLPGSGMHFSGQAGGRGSQSISEEVTVRENGETMEYRFTVEIIVDFAEPAEAVTVLHMNGQDEPVYTQRYAAADIPQRLTPAPDAQYLIVRSEYAEGADRQLCQRGEDSFEIFLPLDSRLCEKATVYVDWE